jgi:hypothetical protein
MKVDSSEVISQDKKVVIFIKNDSIKKVLYDKHTITSLGKNAQEFFQQLDSQVLGLVDGKETKIVFPRAFLLDPKKTQSSLLQAQATQNGFEFCNLPGFISRGATQPLSYQTLEETARHPIVPQGISHFHLLEKKEKDKTLQKILLPLVPLKPKFAQAVRGSEDTTKDFSRSLTLVEEDVDSKQPITIGVFDVDPHKKTLSAANPAQNAYLAFLYFTQQRDSDAIACLNLCKTGTKPSQELQTFFDYILSWPDASSSGKTFKLKVLLQKANWALSSETKEVINEKIKEILESATNKEDLFSIISSLD